MVTRLFFCPSRAGCAPHAPTPRPPEGLERVTVNPSAGVAGAGGAGDAPHRGRPLRRRAVAGFRARGLCAPTPHACARPPTAGPPRPRPDTPTNSIHKQCGWQWWGWGWGAGEGEAADEGGKGGRARLVFFSRRSPSAAFFFFPLAAFALFPPAPGLPAPAPRSHPAPPWPSGPGGRPACGGPSLIGGVEGSQSHTHLDETKTEKREGERARAAPGLGCVCAGGGSLLPFSFLLSFSRRPAGPGPLPHGECARRMPRRACATRSLNH